jgi:hypothetical protein
MIFYVVLLIVFPVIGIVTAIIVITKDSIQRRKLASAQRPAIGHSQI